MKILLLILLFPFTAWAQINLVPNPSFEDTIFSQVFNPADFSHCDYWYQPTGGTSDYRNEDFGTAPNVAGFMQYARTGVSYGGVVTSYNNGGTQLFNYREYIQVKLTQPLIAGQSYSVGYHYSFSPVLSHSIVTSMGFRFTFDTLSYPSWFSSPPPPYLDQLGTGASSLSYIETPSALATAITEGGDTTAWYPLQTTYTALGGEEFLTIGNLYGADSTTLIYFSTPINPANQTMCYFLIDDVFVIPLQEPATYNCLANACVDPLDGTGLYDSLATCQAVCNATAIEENMTTKQLLKITDVLGRESEPIPNVPLFYRYDDGTVEKRIVVE